MKNLSICLLCLFSACVFAHSSFNHQNVNDVTITKMDSGSIVNTSHFFIPQHSELKSKKRRVRSSENKICSLADESFSTTDGIIDGILINKNSLDVASGIYEKVSPFFSTVEYENIMNRVDARHPNKVWIPRRASTFIGSFNRVMDTLGKAGDVEVLTEIGTTITLGLVKNQSPSQICNSLVKTEGWKSNQFGELGYWSVAIAMGMSNGNSFSESVTDAFDTENIGFWSKIGYGWGYLTAETIIAFEKWMNADEKKALEEKILSNIKKAGYSDEAEQALRNWLSLDDAARLNTPFKINEEWKQKKDEYKEKGGNKSPISLDFLKDLELKDEDIEEVLKALE